MMESLLNENSVIYKKLKKLLYKVSVFSFFLLFVSRLNNIINLH